MIKDRDYIYQKNKIIDYRDQVRGGLFQLHKLITTYFPDCDISSIIKMQNIIDNEAQNIFDTITQQDR